MAADRKAKLLVRFVKQKIRGNSAAAIPGEGGDGGPGWKTWHRAGYGLNAWFWIIVVTIITQFLGHVPINMGLHYFPATYISIVMQVAVVVSAIMAFFAFNQIPSMLQVAGSIIIMLGIGLVSWK